ncbi:hypothetical protein L4D18_21640 [Vibrio campbellii]|uniref:hypothetical protein n=1 Tax=Vibrio campbellii TaxID=680 RepID=UPI003D0A3B54
MLKLDAIVNTKEICENAPSTVTTHFHLTRKCYLLLSESGRLYFWNDDKKEWIFTPSPLHEEGLVLDLNSLSRAGFSFAGLYPCSRCPTTTHNHILIGNDGSVVLNCLKCGSSLPVWRDIWESIKQGVQSYSSVS